MRKGTSREILQVDRRPNKQAKGVTNNEIRHKQGGRSRSINSEHDKLINRLSVKGTLDTTGRFFIFRKCAVTVEHPVDKGYFKKVIRLNDKGRKALKWARLRRDQRILQNNLEVSI